MRHRPKRLSSEFHSIRCIFWIGLVLKTANETDPLAIVIIQTNGLYFKVLTLRSLRSLRVRKKFSILPRLLDRLKIFELITEHRALFETKGLTVQYEV